MTTQPSCMDRARKRFQSVHHARANPGDVFPLLCPVREYEWIPDWQCRMVYTGSGIAEPGCVFQTDRHADGGLDTWVVSHYEPPVRISFVRINSLRVIQYDIRLEPVDAGCTRLTWQQVITAISDAGDRHVTELQEADFAVMIANIEELMNRHLSQGEVSGSGD